MNLTITVPEGSSNHGNQNLLCTPTRWFDYLLFFFSNYFAHAATVVASPGQGRRETIFVVLAALLLPGSGVLRAVRAIYRHSMTESDPLKRAIRAGALCMVVRSGRSEPGENVDPQTLEAGHAGVLQVAEEQPHTKDSAKLESTDQSAKGDGSAGCGAEEPEEEAPGRYWWNPTSPCFVPDDAVIHGQYRLPDGYRLAFVPFELAVELESPGEASQNALFSSYNFPKIMISFVQAIWAIITLYRTRGDQIEQYGYAAFGLTVAPYAFMSVVNIVANFLNTEYPALFLVRTPMMAKARSEGGFFAAEVVYKAVEGGSRTADDFDYEAILGPVVLISLIPLAIIGGLSRFRAQNSTSLQRGFTMSWLVLGIIAGVAVMEPDREEDDGIDENLRKKLGKFGIDTRIFRCFGYGVAAIGGMVVVGLMIRDYGICTRLG